MKLYYLEKKNIIIIIIILSISNRLINIYRSVVEGHGFCPVVSATGRVGYATRLQSWTHVMYPTCPVAPATKRKPNPTILLLIFPS